MPVQHNEEPQPGPSGDYSSCNDDVNPDLNSDQKPRMIYHPIINGLQKIALYETRTMFYLIGSNSSQTRFRTLKIDRTEPERLLLTDDHVLYTHAEIRKLLSTLQEGNRSDVTRGAKLARATSAFGIVGFVRFLKGYYLILVTKRRKVASVGQHSIYKVEDTSIRYIPHESCRINKSLDDEEERYRKLFLNVDLTANFYFSYSYDLTHTLQYNLAPPVNKITLVSPEQLDLFLPDGRYKFPRSTAADLHYTYYPLPDQRYVWNSYLHDVAPQLHPAWKLYITHGFIEQVNMNVFGHSYYLTLIGRRSRMFAGTRFHKRGTNYQGDVANEVESEQIVFDSAMATLPDGRFTSFVQLRGSIPLHWGQDVIKMVPKPPISVHLNDPYANAAGMHFNRLLKRHGAPILILDLTKRRETRLHESLLGPLFREHVDQLNLTMLPCFKLDYRRLDMAYLNKLPRDNAMNHLSQFSVWALKRTGVFCTPGALKSRGAVQSPVYQTGTVRVNCVDCLDRTNTAQYALAKCALAHQLHVLGALPTPHIPWDSDCSRVLEDLYEDHGDTLALQYGGSHLVHRIQTYRHTAKWSSHGSDMVQSISRYYSNTFSDSEKQQSINVFLGVFVPYREKLALWELASDYSLHNARVRGQRLDVATSSLPWWDHALATCLPLPLELLTKKTLFVAPLRPTDYSCVDLYNDFHRLSEMTIMTDHFQHRVINTLKGFMSSGAQNPSPFCPRVPASKVQQARRPSLTSSGSSLAQTITNSLVQTLGGGGASSSLNSSESSRSSSVAGRRRESVANSNSSSDGESSTANEVLGICPALDSSGSWVLSLGLCDAALLRSFGGQVSPALLQQLTRHAPKRSLKLSVRGSRGSSSAEFSEESILFHASNIKEYHEQQENVYLKQQHCHLQKLFGWEEPKEPDEQATFSEEGDPWWSGLTERLFPDPVVTYGQFYKEPSVEQRHLFARYARVAEQTGQLPNYVATSNGGPSASQSPRDDPTTANGHPAPFHRAGLLPSSSLQRSSVGGAPVLPTQFPGRHSPARLGDVFLTLPQSWHSSVVHTRPRSTKPLLLVQESTFKQDSYLEVDQPTVDRASRQLYQASVDCARLGPKEPNERDMELYRRCTADSLSWSSSVPRSEAVSCP